MRVAVREGVAVLVELAVGESEGVGLVVWVMEDEGVDKDVDGGVDEKVEEGVMVDVGLTVDVGLALIVGLGVEEAVGVGVPAKNSTVSSLNQLASS